jgi:cell division protein FtsQ
VNAKTTIRKVLFIALWLCIGGGMLILLLAAITKKNKGECKDYAISIKGVNENFFIDKKDIEVLLVKATSGNIKGEPVASFKLHELEQMLERNTWIDDAELYFDNQDVFHISITEKEPLARLFTINGSSYYIDRRGNNLPLSEKVSARVPVFTGYPDIKKLNSADSVLLNEVREIAGFISKDSFWMSQVSQIDITTEKNFEMIPVLGNHLVKLGNGKNIDEKFHRLMIFYQQVLSITGFDKYKIIDVQFKGQVVTSKYNGIEKIDSVQLKKNVDKLLRKSSDAKKDTVIRVLPPIVKLESDSASASDPSLKDKTLLSPELTNPNPLKSISASNENKTDKSNPKKETKTKPVEKRNVPKAVMPKKPVEDENGGYN